MVYYRKHRPQTIEELDSKDVRNKLYAVLGHKDIAHAFLFTGPKGLGKTSTARIVAKVVNCLAKRDLAPPDEKVQGFKKVEPCNKCDQCISITNGTNLDVLEIDGASNRGIDEIRDLREKVRLSAVRAEKKVYIIDEVHMLTTEAFNALLKTLEEPPPHVIFILCTTEPHKLPQTIISRCFHIAFNKAEIEELLRSFKRIAKKEELDIDDEALDLVANLSDGSFRDGAKILEEMATFNKKITKELVEQKYQIRELADQISQMIEFLSEKNTSQGLKLISKLVEQGVDFKYFLEGLISELHKMLLAKAGVIRNSEFRVPARGEARQRRQSSKLTMEEIKELVEILVKAHMELKYAVLPQLPLEMVIVEWTVARGPVAPSSHPMSSVASSLRALDGTPSSRATPRSRSTNASRAKATDVFWHELINRVKSQNHSIAAVLRGCELKEYNGKNLVLETKYKFHKERLDEKKTREIIEKVCNEFVGKPLSISVILKIKN